MGQIDKAYRIRLATLVRELHEIRAKRPLTRVERFILKQLGH